MESDGQRLYSVLTRTDVRDKMMKEIVQISEVFSLSQSDATVALIRLGWDSFRASDLLGDNKEKFLSELGLVHVPDSNPEMIQGDGDNLFFTPLCSHKFCSDCWRDYLEKQDKKSVMISCLKRVCVASVGPDTIEKLEEPVKEMYERYVLESFMESNKIKWCPASGCEYAIGRHEDGDDDGEESSDFGVVCLCGHTFCWKCRLESHRPVTCNNASLWLNELLDEAKTLSWITENTKPCPRCNSDVQKHRECDLKIVTCVCSYAFCWWCLRPEEDHRGLHHCSDVDVPQRSNEASLLQHVTLWEVSHEAVKGSKHDLEAIELKMVPVLTESCGLGELDMRALREASMLIVQCRLVLKWSFVFGYFISDYHSAKKQYLDHLREKATANLLKHKGSVDELVKGAIVGEVINGFRHKLETSTTATGNYFHSFVKTVEDCLPEVKAGVYENVPTDYWFCDRCTFQNESFEQKCRICVFPFEGPSPLNNNSTAVAHQQQEVQNVSSNPFASPPLLSFGVNNSTASAHQQQASNMSSNPFASQGGTNTVAFGNNNITASAQQQGVPYMSSNPLARTNTVAFGNNNITASAQQQGVPYMSNNPFAREGGTNTVAFGNSATASGAHQQQVPNMSNNPFARQGGTNLFESRPVVFGNNIGASAHQPNMTNNPFPRREVPIFFKSPPLVAAYGNNSAHQQQQVPNMANNPFASPGGTYLLQSPPLDAFGNNNNVTASAHQQQAPNMMENNPFARQGGTHPHVGLGNNNNTASVHQQRVPNMPYYPPLARQGEATKPWKFD